MSFFNYFRNFFGGNRKDDPAGGGFDDHQLHRDNFRNPIWQNDEDDDDVDDFRHHRPGIHFSIFSDPFEITRYFESQMDNMLKDFFSGFQQGSFFSEEPTKMLPFYAPEENKSLRDKVLKPESPFERYSDDTQKMDTDLDGKITPDEFANLWDGHKEKKEVVPFTPKYNSFNKSIKKEIVRRADGTIEHRQTIRDSEGNEETIVSRQIGDKKHTIVTRRDKNGVETKTEDLINMDENELKDFDRKWVPSIKSQEPSTNQNSLLNSFPWEKFFGPNPKL